jgi:hypothetical protein
MDLPKLTRQPAPITTNLFVELLVERALKIQDVAMTLVRRAAISASKAVSFLKSQGTEVASIGQLVQDAAGASAIAVALQVTSRVLSPSCVEMRLQHELQKIKNAHEKEATDDEDSDLKNASLLLHNTLTVNVVIDEEHYALAVAVMLDLLFVDNDHSTDCAAADATLSAFTLVKSDNGWASTLSFDGSGANGGPGVQCLATIPGEDDGVAFTPDDAYPVAIHFHTPASFMNALSLWSAWSRYREANIPGQRKSAMARARLLVANVPVPRGAKVVLSFDDLLVSPEGNEIMAEYNKHRTAFFPLSEV